MPASGPTYPVPPSPSSDSIVDNRELRSEFTRKLIDTRSPRLKTTQDFPPRKLVQFWNDARDVPADVQACIDSWSPLENLGFQRLLFNDVTAHQFIDHHFSARHVRAFNSCGHPAMRADFFRLCFILKVGGLYVDADDRYLGQLLESALEKSQLQMHPLCYDIPTGTMVSAYAAASGGEDFSRIFYVNNNPLLAPAGHPLLARALERATSQILSFGPEGRDIQSLTGPGNLTASLVEHALILQAQEAELDFVFLPNWDAVALSAWPLDYRSDHRNWRNWEQIND